MKHICSFFLLCFILFSAHSQILHEERWEFALKDGYEEEKVVEFGQEGLVLFSKKEISLEGKREWKFEWIDSSFNSLAVERAFFDSKQKLSNTYKGEQTTYMLLKNKKGQAYIVNLDIKRQLQISALRLERKMDVKEMIVSEEYAFLIGRIKQKPYLWCIDLQTKEHKMLPLSMFGIRDKNIILHDLQTVGSEMFLYLKVLNSKKKNDLFVMKLGRNGEKEEMWNLTSDIEKNLVDISASKIDEAHYVFTGTYSSKNPYEAEGLFLCEYINQEVQFAKFYDFLDLDHFVIPLTEKRQKKIERKRRNKQAKGKDYHLSYHIAYHEVMPIKGGYVVLGEAYYPTYTTEMVTSTVGDQTTTTYVDEFDGYQYSHAVLARFDLNGELIWDETFEMKPSYKPFSEEKFISVRPETNDVIGMLFTNRHKIVSKTIDINGNVLQEKISAPIDTGFAMDRSKYTFSRISHWYDDYFLVYGWQRIKNKESNGKVSRKRKVYFMNKVKYKTPSKETD